jgi:hypothetical protein
LSKISKFKKFITLDDLDDQKKFILIFKDTNDDIVTCQNFSNNIFCAKVKVDLDDHNKKININFVMMINVIVSYQISCKSQSHQYEQLYIEINLFETCDTIKHIDDQQIK